MSPAEATDRLEISDLLTRYARAVDRHEWDLWSTVFTADATIDYRSAGGIDGDRDTVLDWLRTTLSDFPFTMHYVSNITCDLDGDSATVEAMFYNPMQFPGSPDVTTVGGYYHHELVRLSEGWRSRNLMEETIWMATSPRT